jgi:hypothetical protein
MKKGSLKIVKVAAEKSPQYTQEFRSQPTNYLRIIENKDKVKYEYLNKDFDPKHDLKQLSGRRLDYPNPRIYDPDRHNPPTTSLTSSSPTLKGDLSKYTFDIPLDSDDEDYRPKHGTRPPPSQPEESFVAPHPSYTPPRPQTITHTETYSPKRTPPQTPQQTPQHTPHQTPQHTPSRHTPETHEPIYNYDMHTPPKNESNYSRLRDFLNGSDNEESDDDYYGRHRIHKNKVVDPNKYMSEAQKQFNRMNTGPPTLDELEKRGEYSQRKEYMDVYKMNEMLKRNDYEDDDVRSERSSRPRSVSSRVSVNSRYSDPHIPPPPPKPEPETQDSIDDKKRDFLCKLDMLRKKYPEYSQNVPFMTMNHTLTELQNVYYAELRKLEIDSNASDYRQYLIYGFMITEFILGKYLRLDLEGFTQQQLLNMKRYDRLLIELGEKNYVPDGKKWPVEIRLVGFIIIQAAAFTTAKMILKKTGTNLMGMFNASSNQSQNHNPNNGSRRKMRMPDVDLNDSSDDEE